MERCTEGRHFGVIVFRNRFGETMCYPCLTAYLERRRAEAQVAPPPPEPLRPLTVTLTGGWQMQLTGRVTGDVPEKVQIRGQWFWVNRCPSGAGGGARSSVMRPP